MTNASAPTWESKRTDETRRVEKVLRAAFEKADAYRYNSASIRVRVIDAKFEGLAPERRDAIVEAYLKQLPERTQADIINLYTFAPSELKESSKEVLVNTEFDDPSPSML
ncbi:MAG: hypothetical protein WD042_06670 [Phycisphaeraceae bacterium]